MASDDSATRRQNRGVYILVSGVLLGIGGAIALTALGYGSVPMVLGAVIAGAVPFYIGFRSISEGNIVHDDAMSETPYLRAGSESFWILFVVVMSDAVFDILPEDSASGILLLVAVGTVVILTVYHRFFAGSVSGNNETAPSNN